MIWEYPIRVAGISYRITHMDQITSDDIILEADLGNEFDPNAIRVMVDDGGIKTHIGFIPKEMAKSVKNDQLPARGKIVWRSKDPNKPGIRIQV